MSWDTDVYDERINFIDKLKNVAPYNLMEMFQFFGKVYCLCLKLRKTDQINKQTPLFRYVSG
jgi:hypothetical protein